MSTQYNLVTNNNDVPYFSSDPIHISGSQERLALACPEAKMPSVEKLALAKLRNDCCFRYCLDYKVKLYKKAILELAAGRYFDAAQALFFEMEDEIIHKITFGTFEDPLHIQDAFNIRENLEGSILALEDLDLFFNRLEEVKRSLGLGSTPMYPLIMFYEYYRSIVYDIKFQKFERAGQTYSELKNLKLFSTDIPAMARSKMLQWNLTLQGYNLEVYFTVNNTISPHSSMKV